MPTTTDEEVDIPEPPGSSLFTSDPVDLQPASSVSELFGEKKTESINPTTKSTPFESPICSPPIVPPSPVSKKQLWRDFLKRREDANFFVDAEVVEEEPRVPFRDVYERSPIDITLDPTSDVEIDERDLVVEASCCRRGGTRVGSARGQSPCNTIVPTTPEPVPATAPHVLLIVHGINGSCDNLVGNLEKFQMTMNEVEYRLRERGDQPPPIVCEMINWKSHVIGTQNTLFEKITPRHMAIESRMFINFAISDVAFYLTPRHCEGIKKVVVDMLNERVVEVRKREGFANAKFSLVGYSLGSVIVHDILELGEDQSSLLKFDVNMLFLWGSPLAAYLSVKDPDYQNGKFTLPKSLDIYNIFHPHDPVAFRIEPLFYHLDSETETTESELIPFWETGGLASGKIFERSIADAWASIMSSVSGSGTELGTVDTVLVPKRRLDYVLQESVTENLSHKYSMLTAHHSYWVSRDLALFMIKKLINSDLVPDN
jgi:hypothetical protein